MSRNVNLLSVASTAATREFIDTFGGEGAFGQTPEVSPGITCQKRS